MTPSSWRRLSRLRNGFTGGSPSQSRPRYRPWLEWLEGRECPSGITPLTISTGTADNQPVTGTVGVTGYTQTFMISGGSGSYDIKVTDGWNLPPGLGLGPNGMFGQGQTGSPVTTLASAFKVEDMGSGPTQQGQYNVSFTAKDNSTGQPTSGETATAVFHFLIYPSANSLHFSVGPSSVFGSNGLVLPYGILNNSYNATINTVPTTVGSVTGTITSLMASLYTQDASGNAVPVASLVPGVNATNSGTATVSTSGSSQSFAINGLTATGSPLTVTVAISATGQGTITMSGTPTVSVGGLNYPLLLMLSATDSYGKTITSGSVTNPAPYFNFAFGNSPDIIRHAYGLDRLPLFSGFTGTGAGQTIVILGNEDAPAFVSSTDPNYANSDLSQFTQAIGLTPFATSAISNPQGLPYFLKLDASGDGNGVPSYPSPAGDPDELPQDIEWVHALAAR